MPTMANVRIWGQVKWLVLTANTAEEDDVTAGEILNVLK